MALPRGERLLVVALVVALSLGLLAVALVRRGRGPLERYDPRASTMLSGIHGAKAYYLLLQEIGVDVGRHFRDLTTLPDEDSLVLALLGPIVALRPEEVDSVLHRVELGAGLLVVEEFTLNGLLEELGFSTRPVGDTLWVRAAGAFEAHGVGELSPAGSFFVPRGEAPEFEPLIVSDSGAVAITFPYGEGRVVAFADGRYFANGHLRVGDNALVAVNAVAAYWSDPLVTFDEFHHGFGEGGRTPQTVFAFLLNHPLGWASLQLALAGLALLYLHGRRFGAARPPSRPRRRSEIEHVEALAAACGKARADRAAAERMLGGLDRRLGLRGRWGVGRGGEVLDVLERWVRDERSRAKVRRLKDLVRGGVRGTQLTEVGRLVYELEEEVGRRWTSVARRSSRALR